MAVDLSAGFVPAGFASTPDPPYTAVIFTSARTGADPAGYAATAEHMERLAAEQQGYLGVESVFDPATSLGITVSYWATPDDARAWRAVAEHVAAQQLGRERWYQAYRVRVATVTTERGFEAHG